MKNINGPSLITRLASCNKSVRDKTVDILLTKWLPTQTQIDNDDMKKLWKGLFYCVWHSDKVPVQAALIDRLSSVLPSLHLPLSLHYLSVFLLTIRREWTGIDALRLDKFYLLIRRFLHYFFVVLRKCCWDIEVLKKLMGVLIDNSLLADDKFQGNGVSYHIVSIFVDELRSFLPLKKEVLEELFVPFVSVLGKVKDKVLVGKIKSCVFDVLSNSGSRLLEMKKSGEDEDSGDDVVVLGTIGLVMGYSTKFFEMGSSEECCQGNRKVLFRLHEDFLKLEKDLASSGVVVSIPEVSVDDDAEVPTLVPIVNEMEVDAAGEGVSEGSAKKVLKKCKKSDKEEKVKKPKKKKRKNAESISIDTEEGSIVSANGDSSVEEQNSVSNLVSFHEFVISNLQMQFEKVAAEVGMDGTVESSCGLQNGAVNGTIHKKRKRAKSGSNGQQSQTPEPNNQVDAEGLTAKSAEKSEKKVRFSMKSNLVWKPQSPLPPQSLRIPPSVTPRGSALKKGVAPGPVREMPIAIRKAKQRSKSPKKARKVIKIETLMLRGLLHCIVFFVFCF
ncbi:hypothetical protein Ddye_026907 [Dipteronia dyeriana]|uniref:Ribosomal RNA processing 1 n=1 Tax=Dipteronia dyeriana TaxID=168575 RepID=A0AAD9TN27_9ROSI|nr:hypothetical protein Ddye_026907 [Dipteronia dyeriana]